MKLLNRLTVAQFQELTAIDPDMGAIRKKLRMVCIVNGIDPKEVEQWQMEQLNAEAAKIDDECGALSMLPAKRVVRIGGKRYRMEWFIDQMTAGQMMELLNYQLTSDGEVIANLHLLLASLTREVTWWGKTLAYDGGKHAERAEAMKQAKMADVWGFACFFLRHSEPLLKIMQTYFVKELRSQVHKCCGSAIPCTATLLNPRMDIRHVTLKMF